MRPILLSMILFIAVSCNAQTEPSATELKIQMIFWEIQSWESGGGKSRLTIWADGRSEIRVVPDEFSRRKPAKMQPREGWAVEQNQGSVYFVRSPALSEKAAKKKFDQALSAGIHLLKSFRPDYVDGSGTLVGVLIDGKLKETVIPMFLDRQKGTENHRRFTAVSKILSGFDNKAYDIRS